MRPSLAENVRRLLRHENGATAIEYCLIAAFISIAIAATLPLVGANLEAVFQKVAAAF